LSGEVASKSAGGAKVHGFPIVAAYISVAVMDGIMPTERYARGQFKKEAVTFFGVCQEHLSIMIRCQTWQRQWFLQESKKLAAG
jgi:hypothetical protein